jgi:DNA polymerase IV
MQKHDGAAKDQNPNAKTIAILQEMHNYYESVKDTWRSIAYRKAISMLRKQNHIISTAKEALSLPNIGPRLALKIEEIATTDRLRRLESAQSEPNDRILGMFSRIYGVGFSVALKWVARGLKSMAEVEKLDLTANQRIGLDHYDDFLARIPRTEVQALGAFVSEVVVDIDPDLRVHIMGSYRRGTKDCGDVDMMVTKKDTPLENVRIQLLDKIVPALFGLGFLKAGLAITSIGKGTKWHGACCLPGSCIWRRIDFLLVPYEEIGAAMIYFTGNDIFNRSIRLLASRRGMRLNQHGLWKDVMRGRNRERITQGSMVQGESERRIFDLLGVPWRPPEHRNC